MCSPANSGWEVPGTDTWPENLLHVDCFQGQAWEAGAAGHVTVAEKAEPKVLPASHSARSLYFLRLEIRHEKFQTPQN